MIGTSSARQLLKRAALAVGLEVRRAPDPSLPFLHTVEIDGDATSVWIVNSHTREWWFREVIGQNSEWQMLKRFCKEGSVVLEAGAHHGIHTLALARWCGPSGHVHAFELDPGNTIALMANLYANHISNCDVRNAAVGSRAGTVRRQGERVGPSAGLEIEAVSLDQYVIEKGEPDIGLIKIDVEGFEIDVLRGARGVLARRPHLAVEIHLEELADYGHDLSELDELVDLANYDAWLMVRPDWERLTPFRTFAELPGPGVLNLFLRALDRPVREPV